MYKKKFILEKYILFCFIIAYKIYEYFPAHDCYKIVGIAINYGKENEDDFSNQIYAYLIQDKGIFDNLNNQDPDIDKIFDEVIIIFIYM